MLHFLLFLVPLAEAWVPGPKIIGARNATISEVPYTCGLIRQGRFYCGATILNEKFVLTSAACLRRKTLPELQVRVGSTYSGKEGVIHGVKSYKIHPKNEPAPVDYDCGIVELDKPIEFNENAKPIEIAENEAEVGEIGQISGWGYPTPTGCISDHLQTAKMSLVSREKCKIVHEPFPVTERMVCAFTPGVGPYKADSGDPMVVRGKLIGLASWGSSECDPTAKPAVFANILEPEIRKFIKDVAGV